MLSNDFYFKLIKRQPLRRQLNGRTTTVAIGLAKFTKI